MNSPDNKFEYVEPDDPSRCQAVHRQGQCRYKSVEGSQYCPMHGGHKGVQSAKVGIVRQYQLAKWQSSVDSFADEDQVKSLRGEIGILRLMLQETIAKCKDSGQLLLHAGRISDMVMKVEKVVNSCHRLESNMGVLLDKGKILTLAAVIVEIISKHVLDDEKIAVISSDICKAVIDAQGNKKDES